MHNRKAVRLNHEKLKFMKRKCKFIKSAWAPNEYPATILPEVVMTGRSNAGKSSLINAWTSSQLAKVSSTPGKTRLINFFECGPYNLVDLPGYGFAARSGAEIKDFQKIIESYFSLRTQICCLILVMDIRRDWSDDEELLRRFAHSIQKPLVVVASKIDKLNQKDFKMRQKILIEQSRAEHIYFISSTQKKGLDDLEDSVYRQFVHPKINN